MQEPAIGADQRDAGPARPTRPVQDLRRAPRAAKLEFAGPVRARGGPDADLPQGPSTQSRRSARRRTARIAHRPRRMIVAPCSGTATNRCARANRPGAGEPALQRGGQRGAPVFLNDPPPRHQRTSESLEQERAPPGEVVASQEGHTACPRAEFAAPSSAVGPPPPRPATRAAVDALSTTDPPAVLLADLRPPTRAPAPGGSRRNISSACRSVVRPGTSAGRDRRVTSVSACSAGFGEPSSRSRPVWRPQWSRDPGAAETSRQLK